MKHPGFTLAELLIALALLGIIAAFTIPKVLQSNAEQERVAKLRETVSTLEQVWYNTKANNRWVAGTFYANVRGALNTVSASTNPPGIAGSVYQNTPGHPCIQPTYLINFASDGWFQFANGVVVVGVDGPFYSLSQIQGITGTPNRTNLCIDINGPQNPNQLGQDVFLGTFDPYGFPPNSPKAFLWGNTTDTIQNSSGGAPPAPYDDPNCRVGTWLAR